MLNQIASEAHKSNKETNRHILNIMILDVSAWKHVGKLTEIIKQWKMQ